MSRSKGSNDLSDYPLLQALVDLTTDFYRLLLVWVFVEALGEITKRLRLSNGQEQRKQTSE